MSEPSISSTESPSTALTRRGLLGAAAVGGASWAVLGAGGPASATMRPASGAFPESLDPPIAGLSYISLDAWAFDTDATNPANQRFYENLTGMQPTTTPAFIQAPLTLLTGSTIRQINVAYQGQPVVSVGRRTLGATTVADDAQVTLAAGGGVKTQTLDVDATLTPGATYSMRAFCSAGDSILGMTIGYVPPPSAFVPYTGSTPRVLDTRGGPPLEAFSELTVNLGAHTVPGARAAVVNLTATETTGPGYLAAFRDGITYPGNSSVNFTAAGQTVANGVICTLGAGRIRVRTGPAASHVIVDAIGSLL